MKELGLQVAARIVASSEPLRALTQMAQNFPNLAAALSRVAVPKQLRAELKKLHRVLQGGPHLPSNSLTFHGWSAMCWLYLRALSACTDTT